MASGDCLFNIPANAFQQNDETYDGASVKLIGNTNHYVLTFLDGIESESHCLCYLPSWYGDGGIDVHVDWACASNTGNVDWYLSMERWEHNGHDLNAGITNHNYNQFITAVPGTIDDIKTTVVSLLKTEINNATTNELLMVGLYRGGNSVSDTANANAYLVGMSVYET